MMVRLKFSRVSPGSSAWFGRFRLNHLHPSWSQLWKPRALGGGGCGGSWAERFPGKAVFPPVSQGQRDRVALMFLLCCACPLHVEGGKV